MKIAVWDTYVQRKDGLRMHFDILVPENLKDEEIIYGYGVEYLKSKVIENLKITAKECRFCHIESVTDKLAEEIDKKGYAILEMENCH